MVDPVVVRLVVFQVQKDLELRVKVMLEAMVTPEIVIGLVAAVVVQVPLELRPRVQHLRLTTQQHIGQVSAALVLQSLGFQ
jgi:hypothetical protein